MERLVFVLLTPGDGQTERQSANRRKQYCYEVIR